MRIDAALNSDVPDRLSQASLVSLLMSTSAEKWYVVRGQSLRDVWLEPHGHLDGAPRRTDLHPFAIDDAERSTVGRIDVELIAIANGRIKAVALDTGVVRVQ